MYVCNIAIKFIIIYFLYFFFPQIKHEKLQSIKMHHKVNLGNVCMNVQYEKWI